MVTTISACPQSPHLCCVTKIISLIASRSGSTIHGMESIQISIRVGMVHQMWYCAMDCSMMKIMYGKRDGIVHRSSTITPTQNGLPNLQLYHMKQSQSPSHCAQT